MTEGRAAPGERKRELLGLLADRGEMSTSELVDEVDIVRTTVCRHMNRYRRHGDVERDGATFSPGAGSDENTYSLTDKGREKVRYFRESED